MPKFSHMLAGAVTAVALLTDVAAAEDTVGVSWRYFGTNVGKSMKPQ